MSPPTSLMFVFVYCIVSIVGTIWYAVTQTLSVLAGPSLSATRDIVVGFANFSLPLVIAYTIITNQPSSRYLIAVYLVLVYGWTVTHNDLPAIAGLDQTIFNVVATGVLAVLVLWLTTNRKVRYYYAQITGAEVPEDLASDAARLAGRTWVTERRQKQLQWLADHLETIVLIGLIVTVVIAFVATDGRYF